MQPPTRLLLSVLVLTCATSPAGAGNGHLLHGVGAVNSSLGGVACALPVEVIGTLHVNPAVLTQLPGYEVGFSAEAFSDQPKATATFRGSPGRPDGSFTTEGDTELGVIPAIAVSYRPEGRPWAVGFGLLGVAGFRTDWPQDPNNPIFAPQPDGFGAVKTNLAITKIPFALAWEVSPRLSVGGALVVYQGGLAISPLPPAPPDCTNPTPGSGRTRDCFYADADNVVHSYALAAQLGLYYQLDEAWSLGLSYTSPQDFDDYEWNSQVALPYLIDAQGNQTFNPAFGRARKVRYALDGPQLVSIGVGWRPRPGLKVGFDGRWVDYSSVDGAGGTGGFKPDASLNEIGWDDILVGAIGVEWQRSERLALRAGFNYSQTPIREEVVFTSLGTPPTFKDHYTVGLGFRATDKLELNVGAYWAPEHEVSGPLLSPFLPGAESLDGQRVPGGTFTISERIVSGLAALSYRF
jgi:long-chain fatty acid transport protein